MTPYQLLRFSACVKLDPFLTNSEITGRVLMMKNNPVCCIFSNVNFHLCCHLCKKRTRNPWWLQIYFLIALNFRKHWKMSTTFQSSNYQQSKTFKFLVEFLKPEPDYACPFCFSNYENSFPQMFYPYSFQTRKTNNITQSQQQSAIWIVPEVPLGLCRFGLLQ